MESPIKKIQIPGDDTYFIHFDTVEMCRQFQLTNPGEVGHMCCSGKGCRLVNIGSWDEMHKMKNTFLTNK